MSTTIAFISDIHMDFYIKPENTSQKRVKKFIDETLKPKKADILVIAGDTSHYISQIKLLLTELLNYGYKKILFTYGNHEMYLVSNNQRNQYKKSYIKIEELKNTLEKISDKIIFLDGNYVEFEGLKIGGLPMWYDYSYGLKLGKSEGEMFQLWKQVMNDSNYIVFDELIGIDALFSMYSFDKPRIIHFNPMKFFGEQKEKLLKIIDKLDIVVSHIGPIVPPNLDLKYQTPSTGFYYFDGEDILKQFTPKLWIFGHTHQQFDFMFNKTNLVCNPLGYKSENKGNEIRMTGI